MMSQVMNNDRWFLLSNPVARARMRLFCFPYAGGAASIFYSWHQYLPEFMEIRPVQLPGRENRIGEPLLTHLNHLVPMVAQAIRPYLDLPFVFFGHSLGALLSFELVRYLRRHQFPVPVHLFVSGHQAPQLPKVSSEILHQLPDAEFIESIKEMNGTPDGVFENMELLRLFLPILRADFTLAETYSYVTEPPLSCAITAFGGNHDPQVTQEGLGAWEAQTASRFKAYIFPGDHFFLHGERVELLKTISNELNLFHRAFPE